LPYCCSSNALLAQFCWHISCKYFWKKRISFLGIVQRKPYGSQ
jgi:hypothetical protein